MSYKTMRKKIDVLILNGMGHNFPNIPVRVPGAPKEGKPELYVAYYILEGEGRQAELGLKSINRHVGILQLDALMVDNLGYGELDEIGAYLQTLFDKKTFQLDDGGILRFRVASIKDINEEHGFIRKMVSIPYIRDDPKT